METGVTAETDKQRDVRRPMNAFLIFCKRHRSIVREKNPDLDNRSVTRILGDLWAKLKDDEKTVYTDLAKQYKDAFMKANPHYKWHNPEKTVTCPKATDGAKSLKTEINMLPEGSIMPGKLADPSNMGGLSLLLMAGEQSIKDTSPGQDSNTSVNLTTDKGLETAMKYATETGFLGNVAIPSSTCGLSDNLMEIGVSGKPSIVGEGAYRAFENKGENSPPRTCKEKPEMTIENSLSNLISWKTDHVKMLGSKESNPVIDDPGAMTKPLLFQAVAAPKMSQKSLLSEALKTSGERGIYSEILRDSFTSTMVSNIENQITELPDGYIEDLDKKTKPLNKQEKENFSKLTDLKEEAANTDSDESPMITCGKMVVNHIIDQLYSSDISVAARKASAQCTETASKDAMLERSQLSDTENDKLLATVREDMSHSTDLKDNVDDNSSQKHISNYFEKTPEFNNNIKSFDEADGLTEIKSSRKRQMSQSSSKGNESTDHEDSEELQPLRKSRRRNKGQRYQKLINDGIIQPSKERMAALQQDSPKHDSIEEDYEVVHTYNSYILPETAMRRFRKRTTSESAKDKMVIPDDVKRYKTGDFDLEAQIATLPACVVENMGRKRGFARQRHNSECIHTSRKSSESSDHSHLPPPVFDIDKTVSLPPHIKIASPEQKSLEPVVGSRKRKARKHSITHLLPAPPTVINNGANNGGKGKSPDLKEVASVLTRKTSDENLPQDVTMATKLPLCCERSDKCDCSKTQTTFSENLTSEVIKEKICSENKGCSSEGIPSLTESDKGDNLLSTGTNDGAIDKSVICEREGKQIDMKPSQEGKQIYMKPGQECKQIDMKPSQEGKQIDMKPSQESKQIYMKPSQEGKQIDMKPSQDNGDNTNMVTGSSAGGCVD